MIYEANIGPDSEQSQYFWGGHNWEKHFIALFHVSEHVDHFKAIQKFPRKKQEIVWPCLVKEQTISCFFLRLPLAPARAEVGVGLRLTNKLSPCLYAWQCPSECGQQSHLSIYSIK